MCVHASLSQDGFYLKGIWVGNIPWHHFPLASKEPFLCMCGWGDLLTSRKEMCHLSRAQPPPLHILLFLSWKSRFPGGLICLLPQTFNFFDDSTCLASVGHS